MIQRAGIPGWIIALAIWIPVYYFLRRNAIEGRINRLNSDAVAGLDWISVRGQLFSMELGDSEAEARTPKELCSLVTVRYSYQALEYESGERSFAFASQKDAEEFMDKNRNQPITVNYNPNKPSESTMDFA